VRRDRVVIRRCTNFILDFYIMRWKTISIYLPSWESQWLRICDTKNWIAKIIAIPRARVEDGLKRDELKKSWIYVLVWEQDDLWMYEIYVWEAEKLINRIRQHNSSKDFWNSVICFVSEKNNLNKAHVRYLENYLCDLIKSNNTAYLTNSNTPNKPTISEQETDFVLNFFDECELLIASLWYNFLSTKKRNQANEIFCKSKWIQAFWNYIDWSILVKKWSECIHKETKTAWSWVIWMRKKLVDNWILLNKIDRYVFNDDYMFNSPSAAAAVVLARRANWWLERKDDNNKTIDELERQ